MTKIQEAIYHLSIAKTAIESSKVSNNRKNTIIRDMLLWQSHLEKEHDRLVEKYSSTEKFNNSRRFQGCLITPIMP